MTLESKRCDYVLESGPADSKTCCGKRAKWRTSDNNALCDDHKACIQEEVPGREITPLDDDA